MRQTEAEIREALKTVDRTLLDATGNMYVQVNTTLNGIIRHLAVKMTYGREEPTRCMLQWIKSTLNGEANPAIERDLQEVIEPSGRTICQNLRRALETLVDDVASLLGLTKRQASEALGAYACDIVEQEEPPEDGFAAWADTYLALEAAYPDDRDDDEEEAAAAAE